MAMYGYDREMDGAADGMNEAGFSAHMLYLGATVYPQRDTGGKPNLSYLRWARYLIDTCATVEDAIEAMKNVNIVEVGGGFRKYTLDGKGKLKKLGAHVAVQDKTGDAAIFELGKDGVLTICHEGKVNPDGKYPNFNKCRIMTNDPPLAQQYEYMSRFTVNGNSENGYPLPGTTAPNDRFTRAHFFNDHLTLPKNSDYVAEDFASKVRSLMNNIVVPVDSPPIFPTWYMTVSDLFSGKYNFHWLSNPYPFSINVYDERINYSVGSGIEEFDPKKPELCGDQTCQFVNGGADCSECGMLPRPPSPTSPPRPPTASPTSYYTSAPTKIKSCKK
jgi:choloylglycine hydrolase